MEDTLKALTTLTELLDARAQKNSTQTAFHFHTTLNDYETVTYLELQQRAQNLAGKLLQSAQPGERVLIVLEPGIGFIVAYFAALYAGLVAVPIYPPADKTLTKKMQHVIDDCQPQLLLSTEKVCQQLKIMQWINRFPSVSTWAKKRYSAKYPQLNINTYKMQFVAGDQEIKKTTSKLPTIQEDTLAFLQYSSGSTGEPKGIMLTHKNLMQNSRYIFKDLVATENQLAVIWLPPYHDMGLIGGILQPIYAGFLVVLFSPINFVRNPKLWLQLITRYKATVSGGPNFCFAYTERMVRASELAGIDLSSIRTMFNGAEPVKASTMDTFTQKFSPYGFSYEKFFPCYGLAEATLYITAHHANSSKSMLVIDKTAYAEGKIVVLPASAAQESNASVIVAAGPVQNGAAIYDAEKNTLASENQLGEIIIHNPCVAQGYWGRPELSKETFSGVQLDGKDYLKTGDVGFIYQNILFISGRNKDVIIVRGKNYYPHDLEEIAQQKLSFIRPGGCVAIEDPDVPEQVLFIAEVREGQAISPDQFTLLSKSITSSYGLHVSTLVLVPRKSLPKTTSGKMRRFLCKKMYINNEFIILAKLNQTSVKEKNQKDKELLELIFNDPIYLWILNWFKSNLDESIASINMTRSLNDYLVESTMQIKFVTDLANVFFVGDPDVKVDFNKDFYYFYQFIKKQQLKAQQSSLKGNFLAYLENILYVPAHFFAKMICRSFGAIFCRAYIQIDVKGYVNLEANKPYIFISNHSSHLDSLILYHGLKHNKKVFLAARDYFFTKSLRKFCYLAMLPLLPIEREDLNVADFVRAEKVLRNNCSLVIYPEGTRSVSGRLQKFKAGAALLSMQTQVPVVPIYIDGAYKLWPKGQDFPKRGKVTVIIGKPILPPNIDAHKETFDQITQQYEAAVYELSTQSRK